MYRSGFSWPRQYLEVSGQALLPGRFTPGERASCTHWRGGWVGPRTGLGDRDSKSDPSVVHPVASRYEYSIPVPNGIKRSSLRIYRTIILPVVLYGCETWSTEGV
jgi:hypothetical protein